MPLPLRLRVADKPCNRQNAYWRPLIGRTGLRLLEEVDGMWAVALDGVPVPLEGSNPERFDVVPWPWHARAGYRIRCALSRLRWWP